MKAKTVVILLIAGVVVSGCWDNEKERRASEFMSGLTKCDDCKFQNLMLKKKEEDRQ